MFLPPELSAGLSPRDRWTIGLGLLAVTALAWVVMVWQAGAMMEPGARGEGATVSAAAWTARDAFMVFVMWAVMMAAMMVPATSPMIAAFATINRRRRAAGSAHVGTPVFLLGYIIAWSVFSIIATGVHWALEAMGLLTPMMASASPILSAVLFAAAGLYQWTPLKDVCLNRCRTPVGFVLTEWRDGPKGAVVMGLRHGLFCIGCCAALMALLFAVAVMDLRWVAALAVLVTVEKLLPWPQLWRHLIGAGLVAASVGFALGWLLGEAAGDESPGMKALVCREFADDLSGVAMGEAPMPEPGAGEVLLRVRAAGLNYPDMLMCQGRYQFKPPLPFVPGMDLAGEVVGLGEGVAEFEVGDAVAGALRPGALAAYAVASASDLRRKPEGFSFAEAAAYPIAYLTAWVSLVRRANIQPGETLLVHGASGGVGQATLDVARTLGARTIATTFSPAKADVVRGFGADHLLILKQGAYFRRAVRDLTDGRGADVIFDPVGGDVFDESTHCIAFDGRILVIGFTSGRFAQLATNIALIKGISVLGVRAGEYARQFPDRGRENLDAIWRLAAEGKTRPYIHAELPLENAVDGFRMLQDRQVTGKLVVNIDG
jgi:NADPH2:quinone reductase